MVTYCTPADVKRALKLSTDFSSNTTPSLSDVNDIIEECEDDIDNLTQRSWKIKTVSDEFYSIKKSYRYQYGAGVRIKLMKRFIQTLSSSEGDKLEVWDGSQYVDWLTSKTEGRDNDFWFDYSRGVLFLRQYVFWSKKYAIRLTYRYGETSVPKDVRRACALLAAVDILSGGDIGQLMSDSGDTIRLHNRERLERMEKLAYRILESYSEFTVL